MIVINNSKRKKSNKISPLFKQRSRRRYAAGIASALAINNGTDLQSIDVPTLQAKLKESGAIIDCIQLSYNIVTS